MARRKKNTEPSAEGPAPSETVRAPRKPRAEYAIRLRQAIEKLGKFRRRAIGENAEAFALCQAEVLASLTKMLELLPNTQFGGSMAPALAKEARQGLAIGAKVIVGGQAGEIVDIAKSGRGDTLRIKFANGFEMDFSRSQVKPA